LLLRDFFATWMQQISRGVFIARLQQAFQFVGQMQAEKCVVKYLGGDCELLIFCVFSIAPGSSRGDHTCR
jgi:hypothetical protein